MSHGTSLSLSQGIVIRAHNETKDQALVGDTSFRQANVYDGVAGWL